MKVCKITSSLLHCFVTFCFSRVGRNLFFSCLLFAQLAPIELLLISLSAIFLRRSRSPEMGLKGWDVYTGWAGKENGRSKGKWQGEAGVRATPLSFVVVFAGGMECRMALAYQS